MKRVLLSLLMTISLVFAGPMISHAQTQAQAQTEAQAQQGYGTTTDNDSGHWGPLGSARSAWIVRVDAQEPRRPQQPGNDDGSVTTSRASLRTSGTS